VREYLPTQSIAPLVLGIVLGAVGGVMAGALAGHRVVSAIVHLWSILERDHDEELRFDLLLQ
jgi:hypothetical protein